MMGVIKNRVFTMGFGFPFERGDNNLFAGCTTDLDRKRRQLSPTFLMKTRRRLIPSLHYTSSCTGFC